MTSHMSGVLLSFVFMGIWPQESEVGHRRQACMGKEKSSLCGLPPIGFAIVSCVDVDERQASVSELCNARLSNQRYLALIL